MHWIQCTCYAGTNSTDSILRIKLKGLQMILLPNAEITVPSVTRDLLMFAPSFNLLPVAPVEFALSLQESRAIMSNFTWSRLENNNNYYHFLMNFINLRVFVKTDVNLFFGRNVMFEETNQFLAHWLIFT